MSQLANWSVAIGTVLLAWFTWRLAGETSDAVNSAYQQAVLTRDQIEISERQARTAEEMSATASPNPVADRQR